MRQIRFIALAFAATMFLFACGNQGEKAENKDNVYQFKVLDGQGDSVSLAAYEGQVLLVVNTATQCGFTPQYEELQKLYTEFHSLGFEVLDFPCNQFGEQAPGSYDDIHAFCTGTYNITFPQMAKLNVNGDSAAALYTWLKAQAPFQGFDTTDRIGAYLDMMFRQRDSLYDQNPDIKWNFTKFLIGRDGQVAARFEPTAKLSDIRLTIKELL